MRPEDFVVDVTTASTDLNDDRFWEEKYTGGDRYYHVLTHEERRASEAEKKRQARCQPFPAHQRPPGRLQQLVPASYTRCALPLQEAADEAHD